MECTSLGFGSDGEEKVVCFFVLVLVIVEERCLFLFSIWACCEERGSFPAK